MTPEQWQRMKELLLRGVGPSPEEREQAVKAHFPNDPEVWGDALGFLRATTSLISVPLTVAEGTVPAATGTHLLVAGAMCGPYRVIRLIDAGGMGQVFLAQDVRTDVPGMRVRQVALKCLAGSWLESPDARYKLLTEFANWASLETHPHICTPLHPLDVNDPPMLVLVMEYLDGTPLNKLLAKGPLPWRFALTLASQIADGVGCAHDSGILHCDIKAANVIVTRGNQAKVLDFGLSRAMHLTEEEGEKVGTLAYMPPDRIIDNTLDRPGDLYSLGVTLFEMLTGRRPFVAESALDLMGEILEAEPPAPSMLVPGLPIEVDHIMARALAKDPRQRFQSAREFDAALKAVLERKPPTWAAFARRTAVSGALVLGVLYFLGLIGSMTVDAGFGRSGGFRSDLQRPLLVWGVMSLTAPVAVLLSGLLPLSGLAIALRLLYRNLRPLRRRTEPLIDGVVVRFRKMVAPPTETLSQAVLLVQIGVLGTFIWAFLPYIMSIANFVNPVAAGSLADLKPGNDPLHESYLVWKAMMLFALLASTYAVIRYRRSNGEGMNASTIGSLLTIPFGLFLFVLPFQVVYHSDSERAMYASEVCYIVARNDAGQARLFCPIATGERVRTVSLDDRRLVATGIVESVFSEFDRLNAPGGVTR